jgi:hypothetical protein
MIEKSCDSVRRLGGIEILSMCFRTNPSAPVAAE